MPAGMFSQPLVTPRDKVFLAERPDGNIAPQKPFGFFTSHVCAQQLRSVLVFLMRPIFFFALHTIYEIIEELKFPDEMLIARCLSCESYRLISYSFFI